jgi:hypothetical protein
MTTASAAAAPVAATSAAISGAPATPAGALRLRPCFIHHQVSPAEILPVQRSHRAIRVFVIVHFDEGETSRLSRKAVSDEIDA